MAGVMLSNTNIARKIQEEALGSPLVEDDRSKSSASPAPPIIDFRKLPEFNPLNAGLGPDFRLSKYCELRGRGCRVPPGVVAKMGAGVTDMAARPTEAGENKTGISIDCTITPIRKGGLCIVSNTDMFYPILDDPYIMGRVAAISLLSDMYATGVVDVDNILMYLGISSKLTQPERDTIIPLMIKGFQDAAREAGTRVSGGQTILNPWMMMGGVATSICSPEEYIVPQSAQAGDVLVLTKPLGTGVAINCHQWLHTDRMTKLKMVVTEEEVRKAYRRAVEVMGRSNRAAARLLHKYNAHAATDIAGLGLLGHASHLASVQKNEVNFVVHNLPVIAKMASVAKSYGNMFNLAQVRVLVTSLLDLLSQCCAIVIGRWSVHSSTAEAACMQLHIFVKVILDKTFLSSYSDCIAVLLQGEASECSGGLLICLPREQAAAFCKDIEKVEGCQSWIVGIVESGPRSAKVIDKPRIIEVPSKEKPDELW